MNGLRPRRILGWLHRWRRANEHLEAKKGPVPVGTDGSTNLVDPVPETDGERLKRYLAILPPTAPATDCQLLVDAIRYRLTDEQVKAAWENRGRRKWYIWDSSEQYTLVIHAPTVTDAVREFCVRNYRHWFVMGGKVLASESEHFGNSCCEFDIDTILDNIWLHYQNQKTLMGDIHDDE